MIKQLSIFASNEPGQMVKVTDALSAADIDIRAMSVADTQEFGILRLIVSDSEKGRDALKSKNCVVSITEVIGIKVPDRPGSLAKSLKLLADNDINLEYMYAFITISKEYAYVVIRVQDTETAEKILLENGVELVTQQDIDNL
jgi:hypothetical protein